jgi:hypothetical protein
MVYQRLDAVLDELNQRFGGLLAAPRQAAQRGRLDAVHGPDGVWRSSRKAVDAYRRARHQRRPDKR